MPQRHHIAHDVFGRQAALKAVDLNMVEGIPRLGDKAVLHPLFAAGKVNFRRGVGAFSAPAMAIAGLMCPAVPPAAIKTRIVTPRLSMMSGGRLAVDAALPQCLFGFGALLLAARGLAGVAGPRYTEQHAHFTQ